MSLSLCNHVYIDKEEFMLFMLPGLDDQMLTPKTDAAAQRFSMYLCRFFESSCSLKTMNTAIDNMELTSDFH